MDEKEEGSRSISSDIMIRRMKNRERQRRYRARKRLLEASNSEHLCSSSNQSCVGEKPEPELSSHIEDFVWRVYCSRDWKKDARRAHSRAHDGSAEDLDGKPTGLITKENQKLRPARRDWKAEARNKKGGTIVVVEKLTGLGYNFLETSSAA